MSLNGSGGLSDSWLILCCFVTRKHTLADDKAELLELQERFLKGLMMTHCVVLLVTHGGSSVQRETCTKMGWR